jgi:hypothetical protein
MESTYTRREYLKRVATALVASRVAGGETTAAGPPRARGNPNEDLRGRHLRHHGDALYGRQGGRL